MNPRRLILRGLLMVCMLMSPSLTAHAQDTDPILYRVRYLSYSPGNQAEIWSMNPDGSDPTFEESYADYPTLPSSDGRYVADYACNSTDFCETFNIIDLSTNTTNTITIGEKVSGITWSNTGHQLLIRTVIYNADGYSFTNNMFVLNPDGANRVDLVTGQLIPSAVVWSPDDDYILYFAREEFGADDVLYAASPDGSQILPLISIPPCFICDGPRWSADGESIFFSRYPDLYRLSAACITQADGCEGQAEQLTDFTAHYNAIDVSYARYGQPYYSFSPDGDFLIFTFGYRYDNHRIDIGRMSLEQGGWENREILYSQSGNLGGATVSPDGHYVFFTAGTANGQTAIFRMTLEGDDLTELSNGNLLGFEPLAD